MLKNKLHPGKFLQELLDSYNISACQLSEDIFAQQSHINGILKGKKSISSDVAIRMGKYFNTSAQYWLNLQNSYDLGNCKIDNYHNINPVQRNNTITPNVGSLKGVVKINISKSDYNTSLENKHQVDKETFKNLKTELIRAKAY